MMTDQEITQEQFENLLDDVSYLQDEAEAMKYIIDEVPYTEVPPEDMSIYEKLLLIDHAQSNYYRPVVEKIFSENRLLNLSNFESYINTFERPKEDEEINIHKVLNKIIKHRAGLINTISKIPLIDWERGVKNQLNEIISLFEFVKSMVKEERNILKEIADLVLIYQNEKQQRRNIDAKSEQRKLT